jgi:lipopolysaccharide export system protein LptA
MWTFLLLLNVMAAGVLSPAYAIESGILKQNVDAPGIPTTITSQKMVVKNQESQAVFEGMVVLTRGPLTVHSDTMVVQFHSQSRNAGQSSSGNARHGQMDPLSKKDMTTSSVSNRSVNRVEAIGSTNQVKIDYEHGSAICQKAVYFSDEEKIILTGDPVAWEKGTRVSGKRITIFLAEERSVVEGGSHVRIEGEGKNMP